MKRISFIILSLLAIATVSAQGYYDDDIYYDPAKAKEEKEAIYKEKMEEYMNSDEYKNLAAPTYQVYNNSPRDVDEYNRRGGSGAQTDNGEKAVVPGNNDVFEYTERIERFENPEIVKSSDDEVLKELYYANDVNIYIGTPSTYLSFGFYDPWYYPYGWGWSPYYSTYWAWDPWYRPYYYGWYDPFWGPGYWHYPYHYHPHYAWGHPAPNRHYSTTGRRPFGGTVGTNGSVSTGRRPAGGFDGYNSNRTTGRRPSSSSYTRPSNSSVFNNGGSSNGRQTFNGFRGGSSSNSGNNNSFRFYNNSPSRNNSTINRNSGTTRRQSFTTPSNRGGSSSGYRGGSSGGGRGSFGGGRGGRR